MKITQPEINEYMNKLTPRRHAVLRDMEKYAAKVGFPIIGPLCGRLLQQLVLLADAKRIFEMGSGYGYSAITMAMVMRNGGTVECTEFDAANIERGRQHAKAAGVSKRIIWHEGDALGHMRKAKGKYDMVLLDVDKHLYPEALRLAWPKLRKGGVMITDNVLAGGKVVSERTPSTKIKAILEFNRKSYALPDALCSLMPLRDGLLIAMKR